MLSVLNARLNAAQMSPKYVALSFAVYDVRLRQLIVAKAGVPRPILVRDGEIQEIKIEGTPLGMFPDIDYETVTLNLLPGDILVFASDGIMESTDATKQEFGIDRLADVLRKVAPGGSAENISAAILDATDKFSGSASEAHDDRTLVVLRVTERL
jgi:sigma-B regulation protein RsbU (phosphoserine phosphatase)